MTNDRLNGPVLHSIEQETTPDVNFDDLIDKFVEAKARKKKY